MTLDPESYKCPDHGIDLTDRVEEALDDEAMPVAFRRPLLGRRSSGPEPFEVIVSCPGGGQPHQITFAGTQAP